MFFSSNGKQGFGGLDVFKMDLSKGTDAVNVGAPVNTEKDDFAFTFNTVFEEADISFRCSRLRKMIPDSLYKNIEQVITHILKEEKEEFNHWTKACSLHSCKFHKLRVDHTIFNKYLQSENRLLRETAAYAVT